ncbi:hypothetical protein N657DRAFT_668582 [Parathielavia appendiculata]|uniref:Uncharacterized protein n=1 Tax=Parathielavia appendiculata TaxID=2587402 RepID=A0AAN6UAV9_9PEZI|nr:hypothetical protein N657DRAFT_668582 [Parathielavia appendiculata]
MSHGHTQAGFLGFGMPASMGPDVSMLQMNPDPADTLSLLDNSFFLPFDGTMTMSFDPNGPLAQPFASGPFQQASSAPSVNNAEQTPFSPPDDATSTASGPAGNQPRETLGPGSSNNPSALTEFTKRRNWPARIVEELQDLLHILDSNGRIKHVSPSAERLTGYKPSELRDLLVQDLLHPDDVGVFTAELNESIASGTPLRVFYRLKQKDGQYFVFEAVGHAHIAAAKFAPNPSNQTPFCQAVFMMARPYPTKNAALLDSFLEHKMENERLKRKIAELQREEQVEAEEFERTWRQQSQETPLTQTSADASSIPPRERRVSLDSVPTDSAASTRRPSTGSTNHVGDTIEMLTGLRYQEGERSLGITTGNPSPALITGDAGIAIPVDRDPRTGEKKKKLKVAEEYVCTDCGTLESPEWRKGPSGPKTLCNACGLRWAKREKKKSAGQRRFAQGAEMAY